MNRAQETAGSRRPGWGWGRRLRHPVPLSGPGASGATLTVAIKTSIVAACSKCLGKAEGFTVLSSVDTSMAPLGACSMMGLESRSEQRSQNKTATQRDPRRPQLPEAYRSEGRAAHVFLCKRRFCSYLHTPLTLAPFFLSRLSLAPKRAPLILFEEAGDKRLTGVCHSSQSRDVQRTLLFSARQGAVSPQGGVSRGVVTLWDPTLGYNITSRPGKGTCPTASQGHRHVAQLPRSLGWERGH